MRFFRGIAVHKDNVDCVISTIERKGLVPDQGEFWRMKFQHPGDLDALLSKTDLSIADTRPEGGGINRGICACGEEVGAAYYAWQHNNKGENTTPIIVEFDVPIEVVSIDGRDFLYTVLSSGAPKVVGPVLAKVYGERILHYAERAWVDRKRSIPLCDLACYDPEVVRAHHANTVVLGGRYGTIFRNAFIVKLPIEAASIKRVWSPTKPPVFPNPDVTFKSLL